MKHNIIKLNRYKRRRALAAFVGAFIFGVSAFFMDIEALADKVSDIQNQIDQTNEQILELDSQLVDLMADITVLEGEISENAANIANMQQELALAQEAERTQYANMKARMKYMYENNSETDMLSMFIESGSFTAFLNNIEYTNTVLQYDRTLMDSYEATRIDIEEMTLQLQENQLQLEMQQQQLASKQQSLDSMLTAKKAQVADYEVQLQKAKEEAARKAAEAAKKAAAKRAAENAAAVRAAQAAAAASASSDNSGSSSASTASSSGDESNASSAGGEGYNPPNTTGVSGGAVVAYANQFVGNPYVFGGNSLTDGIDCSGFVVQVYAHFGINLSGSRNSAALRSVGSPVSYEYMQAGDIVCYAGHVGIYTGSGTIVEAMDSSHGITNYRPATCQKILAIRRVI